MGDYYFGDCDLGDYDFYDRKVGDCNVADYCFGDCDFSDQLVGVGEIGDYYLSDLDLEVSEGELSLLLLEAVTSATDSDSLVFYASCKGYLTDLAADLEADV